MTDLEMEVPCTGCGKPVIMNIKVHRTKKNAGQSNFYHKECFKPSRFWGAQRFGNKK